MTVINLTPSLTFVLSGIYVFLILVTSTTCTCSLYVQWSLHFETTHGTVKNCGLILQAVLKYMFSSTQNATLGPHYVVL